jgi:hypothetical protein
MDGSNDQSRHVRSATGVPQVHECFWLRALQLNSARQSD